MDYNDRFKSVDELIPHMDEFVPNIKDPLIKSKYIGLLAVASVTAYELAIKDIFYNFSDKKHPILGNATRSKFFKINGRIKTPDLKGDHIDFFGSKYKDRFKEKLAKREKLYLIDHKQSIINNYDNLIVWRNSFAHGDMVPETYEKVKDAYEHGKGVIHCLNEAMVR